MFVGESYSVKPLIVAFWRQVAEDLSGVNGDILMLEALSFLHSEEFVNWADLSELNPEVLRRKLLCQLSRAAKSSL